MSMRMWRNGVPCNSNYDVRVQIDNASRVVGTCTVVVRPIDSPVTVTATAWNIYAQGRFITLTAEIISSTFSFTGSVVDDKTGQPVAGAQVYFVANGQTFSTLTNSSGRFSLEFETANIPTNVAYWVAKTGYIPLARNLKLTGTSADAGTLRLEPLDAGTILVEVIPDLHHLGDNSYGGTPNSQFQKANTEGTVFTRNFTVSAMQRGATGALLTLAAKGLECPNQLLVNQALIGYLDSSPPDGSFGTITFQVPTTTYVSGANTLSIRSIPCSGSDSDDFEFTNVVIRFLGITSTVVEFYNTNLDHYFITADPSEAAAIDNGSAGPGWRRTGSTFKSGGSTAVCRFYGSQSPGPNSHFYTVDPGECDYLKQLQANTPVTQKRWNFEKLDFVSTAPTNDTCAAGLVPIYQAYNNGFARGVDSNHRITGNLGSIQDVVARGWSNEGIVMCAPQ